MSASIDWRRIMVTDRDIYAAAKAFIKRYGDKAAIEAALRADEFGAKNDIDGQRAWIRIVEAIKQLQRTRSPGEPVN